MGAVTRQVFAGPFPSTAATDEATTEAHHCKDSSFSCPDPLGEGNGRMADEKDGWGGLVTAALR